jgi:UDP-GlcNAc:undecaprenyl-phosphate GlcNAc-1-phosphate transferase
MALVAMLLSMVMTMIVLPPLSGLAHRVGIVAVPDARRTHRGAVPQIGGVAIVVSALVAMSLLLTPSPAYLAYLAGASIVFLLGLLDDYRELDYKLKFVVHCIAATIAVVGAGLTVIPLNPPLAALPVWLALPVAVVLLTGTTNAINLVDGLDGLAGGLTLLSCLALAICGYQAESPVVLVITLTIAGGVVGFLRFNTHPARVFMGDNGAFFLGFSLGFVALELLRVESESVGLTAVVMMLGVPVVDAMLLPLRRWFRGRHLFLSDRSHLHHVMLEAGFSHASTVALIYAFHTAFVVLGYTLRHQSEVVLLAIYACVALAMEASPKLLAPIRGVWREWRIRVRASAWLDRGLDALAWFALLGFVVASVANAEVSGDFLFVSAVALAVLIAWWVSRPNAAIGWPERCALYVLGAYAVYLGNPQASIGAMAETISFGVVGVWLVYRLVGGDGREFTLTPLDLIVAVATLCLAVLSGHAVDAMAFGVVELVVWFYAIELLATRWTQSLWLRALASLGLGLIVARGAVGILG